ncbi:MAG: TM2 domain-containing protein [Pseudomonadota bacterium]
MRDWDDWRGERAGMRAHLRFEANRKSALLAYLLWFFLGAFGLHRFYLGRFFTGLMMLGLTVIGSITSVILIGYIPLAIVGLWWLVDALLTYMMVEDYNDALARRFS